MAKNQETYTLEDLHSSINDIHYQFDEGKMNQKEAHTLTKLCCLEFLKNQYDNFEDCVLELRLILTRRQ